MRCVYPKLQLQSRTPPTNYSCKLLPDFACGSSVTIRPASTRSNQNKLEKHKATANRKSATDRTHTSESSVSSAFQSVLGPVADQQPAPKNKRRFFAPASPAPSKRALAIEAADRLADEEQDLAITDELKYSGVRAVLAIREARPADLIKAYVREDVAKQTQVGQLLSWMSTQKKAYRITPSEELDRLAQTVHHEGIVVVCRRRQTLTVDEAMAAELSGLRLQHQQAQIEKKQLRQQQIEQALGKTPTDDAEKGSTRRFEKKHGPALSSPSPVTQYKRRVTVLLEGVKNPHNLGAIIRTCAFFGVARIFASYDRMASPDFPRACTSAAVHRTSEGGAEYVDIVPCVAMEFQAAIAQLQAAHYAIVATSSTALHRESLFDVRVSTWLQNRHVALLFGNESTGLSKRALSTADKVIEIPGTGRVSSLNVSQSAVALLTELMRVHERFRTTTPNAR